MIFLRLLRRLVLVMVSLVIFLTPASAAETQRDAQSVMNGMRLKKWTKDLELTAEQQKQIQSFLDEESRQINKLDENAALGPSERSGKVGELRQTTYAKIKPILSAVQLETFEKLLAKMQPKKK